MFNPDKLVIGKEKIKIFGYNIDGRGIHPMEEMKDAIRGFELPNAYDDEGIYGPERTIPETGTGCSGSHGRGN